MSAVVLVVIGAGAAYSWDRAQDLHARTQFAEHRVGFDRVRWFLDDRNQSRAKPDEALERLRGVLQRYGVPEDGNGEEWLESPDVRRLSPEDLATLKSDVAEALRPALHELGRVLDDPAGRRRRRSDEC